MILERSADHYSAYADNVEGVYGAGNTPQEAKKSIEDAIRLLKQHNSADRIPDILKGEYEIVYKFDVESLLNYYRGIFTNSAFERLTGINQRQFQHYSSGLKKPRPAQKKKIEQALHQLGKELLDIEL